MTTIRALLIGSALAILPVSAMSQTTADDPGAARNTAADDDGMSLGWLGLIGLAGLLGMKRRADDRSTGFNRMGSPASTGI